MSDNNDFCWCPPGEYFGAIDYTLYTSQFHKQLKYSSYHLYADDKQVYYSFDMNCDSAKVLLNTDLNGIAGIASDHMLTINASKSCHHFWK